MQTIGKEINLKKWLSAMLGVIISLLGFSSCSNDDENEIICMYGQPYSKFELKGKVVDTDGNSVVNAQITIKTIRKTEDGEYSYDMGARDPDDDVNDDVFTKQDGTYRLVASSTTNFVRVICTPENTDLAADSTELVVEYKKASDPNDSWLIGSYEGVVDFTLKKKQ